VRLSAPTSFEWFVANKRAEWDEYRSYVTQFETDHNLPRL
jgi:glutamine synthetase